MTRVNKGLPSDQAEAKRIIEFRGNQLFEEDMRLLAGPRRVDVEESKLAD